ncbi:immunoglobulin-like domain-containing protein, partial [Cohnella sp. 56]|uniref:immunoglobulin-like domain-containing protein n=1 Tax=Cohnella sp. 56 TaxID=3113722 RepID=UPI0030EA0354
MKEGKTYMLRRFSTGLFLLMLVYVVQPFLYGHTANAAGTAMAGAGTVNDPYIITDADQLDSVRLKLGSSYKLANDIDLSSYSNWEPIGNSTNASFKGRLDGAGHTITGLTINRPGEQYVGLFGLLDSPGKIENLKLVNVNVTGDTDIGGVGGLVGKIYGTLSYISVSGQVAGTRNVGGIVGDNYGKVSNCFSSVKVTGTGVGTYIGGISGYGNNNTLIENSYATGDVTGIGSVGGIIGRHFQGKVVNSYATGKVSGSSKLGGIIGDNGGGTVTSSFYDKSTTGRTDTGKGDPKTTADMKTKATFTSAGWDFDTVWAISSGNYPTLQAPVTDDDAVAKDKNALAIGYASGDSETNVTQNLTLAAAGASGTTITWSSNASSVIANNGTVIRPSFTAGDQTVTLTATIKKGSATQTKPFTVNVKALPETDAEAVASAKAALVIGYATGDSATGVTQDVTLPTAGTNGTTVTWASNRLAVVAADGTVTRPTFTQGNQSVKLTATIERNGVSDTREFSIEVLAAAQTDAEAVAADKAALAIGYATGDSATGVTQDVTLPTAGTNGTTVTWASNRLAVVAADGTVTRPTFTQGNQSIKLTATIERNGVSDTREFSIEVLAAAQTDAEAVAADKAALVIGYAT